MDHDFFVKRSELTLRFTHPPIQPALSFRNSTDDFPTWREVCKQKLTELLNVTMPAPCRVTELRETVHDGVRIQALAMQADSSLSIPAYLLTSAAVRTVITVVLAIHGHGEVEPCLGASDDYHHQFALELAKRGHVVLCPELRGFGVLNDLAADREGYRLDYWNWGRPMAYSLVTDAFLRGRTLLGTTVEDLLRWEEWLAQTYGVTAFQIVGISYGGDLALTYPVFSRRVERIFASGTLGSFEPIFARCYNAPAHCIPGVLQWMDRADIAGLNAPRPIALHYGELDVPSDDNYSASYNETVPASIEALKQIYAAAGAEGRVVLRLSTGKRHEMDVGAAAAFLTETFG